MPKGLKIEVIHRVWKVLSLMKDGKSRSEIINLTSGIERVLASDVSRLKKTGLKIRYLRKSDKYEVNWPDNFKPIRLNSEEYFYVYYMIHSMVSENPNLKSVEDKLSLMISEDSDPVFDCGPAYGISQNITESLSAILNTLRKAIINTNKVCFFYKSASGEPAIRIVHPYKLIHTPISWYLVAFCEERQAFRNFKLARMEQLKTISSDYKKVPFNIKEHLGDAWWVQHNPKKQINPYKVRVLFKNETAQTVKEYKFHDSQQIKDSDRGTIITWKLSYLGEFASWLMQWLGSIEILQPKELKEIIDKRIEKFRI